MIWDPNEEGVIGNSWVNFNYKWTSFKDYRIGYLKEKYYFFLYYTCDTERVAVLPHQPILQHLFNSDTIYLG